jgi:hypothetical protein
MSLILKKIICPSLLQILRVSESCTNECENLVFGLEAIVGEWHSGVRLLEVVP